ncbi:MAG TPA: class I SAM-dependent methyltransferase [Mycobacteriales bacterium]|nr:class I SAM-dependent methyltransferase [Mycobacteriales bacterium]
MTDESWSTRGTSFGSAADAYAAGRPSYPEAALDWVLPTAARRVLDLAAGTGKLSELLLARGLDVVAVEPSDEMRRHVPSAADALSGTAEAIPLDDASVDCVVVGQAFHWFDGPAAMTEIARVLRPGGTVGLLWLLADDADPLTAQVCDVVADDEMRASIIDPDQAPPYADIAGLGPAERRLFPHSEPYDADRLTAWVLSLSRVILLPEDERAALLDRVHAATPQGAFELRHVCEVWRAERS